MFLKLLALLAFVTGAFGALDVNRLPLNVVVIEGGTVTLRCAVHNAGGPHSCMWTDYATNPGVGQPISDNLNIGAHPERERYEIQHRDAAEYNLIIKNVKMTDGGHYLCQESQAPAHEKNRHSLSVTVLAASMNCTTSIGASGVVLDNSYQTNDCIIFSRGGIHPNLTWSGYGVFQQAYSNNGQLLWAGMHYNVTRNHDTRAHQCLLAFTGYFLPTDGDTADNIPEYSTVYQSRQQYVYWGPNGVDINPKKAQYEPGETLTCTSDAWPPATYLFQNMRTGQIYSGITMVLDSAWVGNNQSIRCEAKNMIEGTNYANQAFLAVDMPAPTTTTPPTTTPTTTFPPAVSECFDLTGAWVSTNPTTGSLCVRIDNSAAGALTGLLKNHTDTYWVDLVGRVQANYFSQVGFNGIWPGTFGVSSFVGECHRCFGIEQLLINVVTRRKGTQCGTEGQTQFTTQYHFYRSPTLSCPNVPTF